MTPYNDIIQFLDIVVREDIHTQDLLNNIIEKLDSRIAVLLPPKADKKSRDKYRQQLVKGYDEVDNVLYFALDLRYAINNVPSSTQEDSHDRHMCGNLEHMINTYYVAKVFLNTLKDNLPIDEDTFKVVSDCVLLSALFHDIGKAINFIYTLDTNDYTENDLNLYFDHGTYGRSIIEYLFKDYVFNARDLLIVRNLYYCVSNHHCFNIEDNNLVVKENTPKYMLQAWDYKPGKAMKPLRDTGKTYPGYEIPLVAFIVSICDKLASQMSMENKFSRTGIVQKADSLTDLCKDILQIKSNKIIYKHSEKNKTKWKEYHKCEFKLVLFDSCQNRFI